ncbi:NAD(P)/FAD-dependent oxidoreductase [Archangium violaceum]|uniref:phytoene desaturase family protein n=1 Tax=Archangium violaceum TaxID=83451 RepID=UPI0019503DB4|nr:NAD(P)/FAD-dependent oxidoreductase [Archangium violaceum]QRN99561.1 NAD(P)/FAD-dependent oxidoreductase [Archangium violaceum]
MKNPSYDVIVIGSGHNGMTAAAYLAKAGLDVCVLEKSGGLGGGCVTRELCGPGFKSDPASTCHITIQANPLLLDDELGLMSKYGLKYHYPDILYSVVFPDDSSFICYRDIDRTCASIAEKFSARDADAYKRFCAWAGDGLEMMLPTMFSACPPTGQLFSMLDQSDAGRETMHALMLSGMQLLDEWFEDDRLKIAMARQASEVIFDPHEVGTGSHLYMLTPFIHRFGIGVPEGGSGVLVDKLAECLRDHGATVRTRSGVRRILVQGGKATGVELETGETLTARRAVVSGVNVKQLFLGMLDPKELPSEMPHRVRRLKINPFQSFCQLMALEEAPRYKAGEEVNRSAMVEFSPATRREFRRYFDDLQRGQLRPDVPAMVTQTLFDPTRAPPGKHTGYLHCYAPYHLEQGAEKWDEIEMGVANEVLSHLERHTTNMSASNLIHRKIINPREIERRNAAFIEGESTHLGNYLFQSMALRPLPGWGQYRTPIDGLYMTGSSTHPGGSISAGSGRASAQILCQDLGIDFERLVA